MTENSKPAPVDLSEKSILEICEQMKASMKDFVIKPDRVIVPPWALKEIEEQYGAPATQEKYHKWNAKRLGLDELAYRLRLK
jgi:hypothetical protein